MGVEGVVGEGMVVEGGGGGGDGGGGRGGVQSTGKRGGLADIPHRQTGKFILTNWAIADLRRLLNEHAALGLEQARDHWGFSVADTAVKYRSMPCLYERDVVPVVKKERHARCTSSMRTL